MSTISDVCQLTFFDLESGIDLLISCLEELDFAVDVEESFDSEAFSKFLSRLENYVANIPCEFIADDFQREFEKLDFFDPRAETEAFFTSRYYRYAMTRAILCDVLRVEGKFQDPKYCFDLNYFFSDSCWDSVFMCYFNQECGGYDKCVWRAFIHQSIRVSRWVRNYLHLTEKI